MVSLTYLSICLCPNKNNNDPLLQKRAKRRGVRMRPDQPGPHATRPAWGRSELLAPHQQDAVYCFVLVASLVLMLGLSRGMTGRTAGGLEGRVMAW